MALLTAQTVLTSGLQPTYVGASAGGDTFANSDERNYLHIKNASASAVNVTINSITPCNHGFDHDIVVSIPAGGERMIGTFAVNRFNNDQGVVSITYSAVASVTVAVIRI